MVPTLINSLLPQSPWCGAAFARENTRRKQRSAAKFSLVYKRARYYDPQTGEFISRDPLEYVDGMSLYRGYFVPGGVDPEGEEWHHTLPIKWSDAFERLGFDIDPKRWGLELDFKDHRAKGTGVESLGWGKDWNKFFKNNPNPTRRQVLEQRRSMLNDPKYAGPLSDWRNKRVTSDFPKHKRNARELAKKKGKLGKFFAALAILSYGSKIADAACGGCENQYTDFKNKTGNPMAGKRSGACQEAVDATLALLDCAGIDNDFSNNIARRQLYADCAALGE